MMFGFGDDRNPLFETVSLMEQMVAGYVSDVMHRAVEASGGKKAKLQTEDLLCALRRVRLLFNFKLFKIFAHNSTFLSQDTKKQSRVKELLIINEEVKNSKKVGDLRELERENNRPS
jgi:transcription initiation factor TFIID subunit 13